MASKPKKMVEVRTVAGADVDQEHVEIVVVEQGVEVARLREVSREKRALDVAAKFLIKHGVTRVVMESTGGLEVLVAKAFHAAGIAVCIVNPHFARSFAKGIGLLAKTDAIDAFGLARYAEAGRDLRTWEPPSKEMEQLVELVRTRASLVTQKVSLCNQRRSRAPDITRDSLDRLVVAFKKEITVIDKQIVRHIEAHEEFRTRYERFRSVPGIGAVVAAVIIVELPELGTISKKKLASLAGVAPFSNDSGKSRGTRTIRGGRGRVRQPLYMAALVAIRIDPIFKAKAAALAARGKKAKVIAVAIMRNLLHILNALQTNKTVWNPDLRKPLPKSKAEPKAVTMA